MKNKIKKMLSSYLIKRGFSRLSKFIAANNDRDWFTKETIDFLFSTEAALITPWQFPEELKGLAMEIEKIRPKTAVEIGTANGGTLFTLSRLAASDAFIISIDLPDGKFGGGYPDWKVPVYSNFARKHQTIKLLRTDSTSPAAISQLNKLIGSRNVDYLLIDGDHTYDGVKRDFLNYHELVKKGIIVFHDIVLHPGSECKVDEFWREIKKQFRHREIVNDWNQGKFGIGILYKE